MSVLEITAEAPPIRTEADGSMRIGSSRVLLDLVIHSFQDGASAETIVQRYSTLDLGDTYAVIGYYLRHKEEVERYLEGREQEAIEIRHKIEAHQKDLSGIRQRLLARLGK